MARCDFASRTIFLNVREIANFQTPKYNNNIDFSPTQINALQEGLKCHKIVQKEFIDQNYNNPYTHSLVEVFVSKLIGNFKGWDLVVRGRIDILQFNSKSDNVSIIEIKTTSSFTKDEIDLFWELQVKYYTYIFTHSPFQKIIQNIETAIPVFISSKESFSNFVPKLIVVKTISGVKTDHILDYDDEQIRIHLEGGIRKLIEFYDSRINHFEHFKIIQDIPWFFDEYRLGQQDNLAIIREGLKSNPIAMLIGPPGTGKTALTLRILLERAILYQKQIMYTSTKNSQQLEVLNLVKLINVQLAYPLWAVVLIAKEKYCIYEEKENEICDPFVCPYYQAMNTKKYNYFDLFHQNPIVDSEWLKEKAFETKSFCPYYQAKELAGFADIIIGDQNYQIDPSVKLSLLKRPSHPLLFSKRGLPYIYLMDEAHNLPGRIRDDLSLQIYFSLYNPVKEHFKKLSKKYDEFSKFFTDFNAILTKFENLPIVKTPPSSMTSAFALLEQNNSNDYDYSDRLSQLRQKTDEGEYKGIILNADTIAELKIVYYNFFTSFTGLDAIFLKYKDLKKDETIITNLFIIRELIDTITKIITTIEEENSKNYQCFYFIVENQKNFELYFLNIADYFQQELKNTSGTIIMSATLHPESFYRVMFGFDDEVNYLTLQNHFPEENRLTLVVKDIRTRYADLNNFDNLHIIASVVANILRTKPGRYLFFVPNLELIPSLIKLIKPQYELSYSQFEEEALHLFKEGIFVCALGSIFSEGVNVPDLTGVIILSPVIPPPSYKNSLLQEYYKLKVNDSKEESFNLAFRIPGLNKILQASGRLHRKSEDRGIIYLLGERFATDYYLNFYPDFLKPITITTSKDLPIEIKQFWSKFI